MTQVLDRTPPAPKVGEIRPSRNARPLHEDPLASRFAKLLDDLGLMYKYEPLRFHLSDKRKKNAPRTFQPDFYLPELNYYVELCKTTCTGKETARRRMFKEVFPDLKLCFIPAHDLDLLEQRHQEGKLNWQHIMVMCMDRTGNDMRKNRYITRRWHPGSSEHLDHPYPTHCTN